MGLVLQEKAGKVRERAKIERVQPSGKKVSWKHDVTTTPSLLDKIFILSEITHTHCNQKNFFRDFQVYYCAFLYQKKCLLGRGGWYVCLHAFSVLINNLKKFAKHKASFSLKSNIFNLIHKNIRNMNTCIFLLHYEYFTKRIPTSVNSVISCHPSLLTKIRWWQLLIKGRQGVIAKTNDQFENVHQN